LDLSRGRRHRVAIVGGGIAGLAAAYRLTQLNPDLELTLFEAETRLGGKILTSNIDGYTVEGGPDSFLSFKPRGIELCRELVIDDQLQGVNEATRRTFVLRHGRLHDLPEGLTGLIPTRLGPMAKTRLISPVGKVRMACDYVIPAKKDGADESLASFIERRLGKEVYENLVEPLMAGIYAGDGRELSLGATFPQLRQGELDHGGLIKGVLAARKNANAASPVTSPFLAPVTGMSSIVSALEERLCGSGVSVVLNQRIDRVVRESSDSFGLHANEKMVWEVDAVILATPAFVTADLLDDCLPEAAARLREIPHVSTSTVALGFDAAHLDKPLVGHGYVIPRVENRPALACTFVSSKWAQRAPEGKALVRVFVGRAGQEHVVDLDDAALIGIARDELQKTLDISAEPEFTLVTRWPQGMPQYTLGHLDRVAAIDRAISSIPGLEVAGNAYRGVGIPDCISSGEAAADRVFASVAIS
jgi:oxygen-dependent protoporphyrinogen oxidase